MSKEQQEEIKKPIKVDYPEFNIEDPIEYQKELDKITDQYFINASTTRTLKNIREVLVNKLRKKYNLTNGQLKAAADIILKIHGLHEDNFDGNLQFSKFLNAKNSNEVSIDGNANKTETGIKALMVEASLADRKLIGFDQLYRVMVELYGREKAKELSGSMYDFSLAIADSTNLLIPYCYAADFSKIVTIGREFGKEPSGPAKSLSTYCNVVCDTVRELSCHLAGAVAISTFFLDSAHLLIYKERIPLDKVKTNRRVRHYITDCYQHVVYSLNHASRDAAESPFTNISCFDEYKLKTLVEDMNWYFPMKIKAIVDNNMDDEVLGHKMTEDEWKDFVIDYIMTLQEIYIDLFNEGNPLKGGLQFAFPVTTMNFSVQYNDKGGREIQEPNRLLNYATKKDIKRYNIYVSEGTKVASCCFSADQKVLVKNEFGIYYMSFKDWYDTTPYAYYKSNAKIFHNGNWVDGKVIKVTDPHKMYKITTINNKVITVTDNHINVTFDGDKPTTALTTNDYLAFSTKPLDTFTEKDEHFTYEQGYILGAFLGDGSLGNNKSAVNRQIIWSLNRDCYKEIAEIIDKGNKQMGGIYTTTNSADVNNEELVSVRISSKQIDSLITRFVKGKESAATKELDLSVLFQSIDFRKGILDGLYATDGGNSNRIYSVSDKLIDSIEILLTSLGLPSVINTDKRVNEVRFVDEKTGKEYKNNYPLKCIRWYYSPKKRFEKDVFMWKNNTIYFKIKSIEELPAENESYCFEMTNQNEPYFTLPNGIITHNCRLINDTEMSELASSVNSFGGSSISLGSDRVVTIDLLRIAFECKDYEDYKRILKLRIDHCAKILKAHRVLIMKLKSLGTQPFISNGWINFGRMFGTYGCIGYFEADKVLRKRFNKDFDYMKDFMIYLNQEVDNKKKEVDENGNKIYNFPMNIEQIPGESMAVKIAKVDKILYPHEDIPTVLANQFVSLWEDKTIYEKMNRDGELNRLLTGGGICHIQCSEKLSSHQAKKLIKYAAKSGCDHFAINGVYLRCTDCNTVVESSSDTCPKCGGKHVEHYTRVIGFFSKVENWIPERQTADFPNRKFVDLKTIDSK